MISTNKISKGIFHAVDPMYQPEGTVVINHNGHFLFYDQGNFKWKSAKGNKLVTILYDNGNDEVLFNTLGLNIIKLVSSYDKSIIVMAINNAGNSVIGKVVLNTDQESGYFFYIIDNNADLHFSLEHPMRQAYVVYENENIARFYWNDGNEPPRSLNLLSIPSPLRVDQLNFTPPVTQGTIKLYAETTGSLYTTAYFYTYRLITDDGVVSDFCMLSNPVLIGMSVESANLGYAGYQNYQGNVFTTRSTVGVKLIIDPTDPDYSTIEVYAFSSIALNTLSPGVLIYKGENTNPIIITHRGTENLGEITLEDVLIRTRSISQCNLMDIVNNRFVIADYAERTELPSTGNILKDKITGVSLSHALYEIPSDYRGTPGMWTYGTSTNEEKPLVGHPINHTIQYLRQWYFDSGSQTYVYGNGISAVQADQYPIIHIKKYTTQAGTSVYEDHSLAGQFLDYKSKKVSHFLKGYRGRETYRYGFLPIDKNGKEMAVRYIGDFTFPAREGQNSLTYRSGDKVNLRIMNLVINNLDITDLVVLDNQGTVTDCLISGFKIVRAPLDKQRISQGVLFPCVDRPTGEGFLRSVLCWPRAGNESEDGSGRIKRLYVYNSPEYLLRKPDATMEAGDKFEVNSYLTGIMSDYSYLGKLQINHYNFYQKFYQDNSRIEQGGSVPNDYKTKGTKNEIEAYYEFPFDKNGTDIAIGELGAIVRNEARGDGNYDGYGCPSILTVLKTEEATNLDHFGSFNHHTLLVVNQLREKTGLYGGSDEAALALTEYVETGHYQEVTISILNSIKNGSDRFVFQNINVFGGDTFINMFDLARILNFKRTDATTWFSHTIIFPIESEINLALRTGYHIAKDRAFDLTYNPYGIGLRKASYEKLEDFNYNNAYSTHNTGRVFLPLPYNYQDVSRNLHTIIWSGIKFLGEAIDNYRKFPVNNIKSVETIHGNIIFICGAHEKLIYLQERGFGYLPMNERVMLNNTQNLPVQLGIGGVFDRDDTTNRWIGCQHFYSVIKCPDGLIWFDFNERAFIYMTYNLEARNMSILAGMEDFFRNDISNDLRNYDNPFYNYGIKSHYDLARKEVIMSFIQPSDSISIVFSERLKAFTGTLDYLPTITLNHNGNTFISKQGLKDIYISNSGANRSFFGTSYPAKLKFIVNNEASIVKIFDNLKIIGSDIFFNSITFRGENFEITENINDVNGILLSSYFERKNHEWNGSFPLNEFGERMRGHYVEIELNILAANTQDIWMIELMTKSRKSY